MKAEKTGEQNRSEWESSDNWTLPIGVYFSKKDTRWLVPRLNPALGWTFNLGNKKGALAMLLCFLIPIVLLTAALIVFVFLAMRTC